MNRGRASSLAEPSYLGFFLEWKCHQKLKSLIGVQITLCHQYQWAWTLAAISIQVWAFFLFFPVDVVSMREKTASHSQWASPISVIHTFLEAHTI